MTLKRSISLYAAAGLLVVLMAPAPTAAAAPLSKTDAETYKKAFAAAQKGDFRGAHKIATAPKDRVLAAVLDWMEMTRRGTKRDFPDFARFRAAHADWPYQRTLSRNAEAAMTERTPAADVLRWFGNDTPVSTDGRMRLISALLSTGKRERAIELIRDTWKNSSFGSKQERTFRRKYRRFLTTADHVARLDHMLWQGRVSQARRSVRLVDKPTQQLAMARIALRTRSGNVDWHIRRVSKQHVDHPGLVYERVKWRRRKGRDNDAHDLLAKVPASAGYAEKWWVERAILTRRLLTKGHVSEAYRLARANGLSEGARFVEAEWLAGWIALRYLKEPGRAAEHFARIGSKVNYPISKARAAYWSGRAAEAAGNTSAAARHFRAAARYDTTYYGQLSGARHGGKVKLAADKVIASKTDRQAFEADQRVGAVRRLHQIGAQDQMRAFVDTLVREARSSTEYLLVAELGDMLGRRDLSVRAARKAQLRGVLLTNLAYPVVKVRAGKPPPALVHAITRQESNFDANAVSRAGARGLMQLMPATARSVAKRLRVPYSPGRLSNPAYNMQLGSAYLGQMLDRFNGSYILAIAAYNAGPGAAARWTRNFGDPGAPGVDPVDWVEMIPYRETRNYVQRVLENLQVYRVRLDGPMLAEAIEKDLAR